MFPRQGTDDGFFFGVPTRLDSRDVSADSPPLESSRAVSGSSSAPPRNFASTASFATAGDGRLTVLGMQPLVATMDAMAAVAAASKSQEAGSSQWRADGEAVPAWRRQSSDDCRHATDRGLIRISAEDEAIRRGEDPRRLRFRSRAHEAASVSSSTTSSSSSVNTEKRAAAEMSSIGRSGDNGTTEHRRRQRADFDKNSGFHGRASKSPTKATTSSASSTASGSTGVSVTVGGGSPKRRSKNVTVEYSGRNGEIMKLTVPRNHVSHLDTNDPFLAANVETHGKNQYQRGKCCFFCHDEGRLFWAYPLKNVKRVTVQHYCSSLTRIVTRTVGIRSKKCTLAHNADVPCVTIVGNAQPPPAVQPLGPRVISVQSSTGSVATAALIRPLPIDTMNEGSPELAIGGGLVARRGLASAAPASGSSSTSSTSTSPSKRTLTEMKETETEPSFDPKQLSDPSFIAKMSSSSSVPPELDSATGVPPLKRPKVVPLASLDETDDYETDCRFFRVLYARSRDAMAAGKWTEACAILDDKTLAAVDDLSESETDLNKSALKLQVAVNLALLLACSPQRNYDSATALCDDVIRIGQSQLRKSDGHYCADEERGQVLAALLDARKLRGSLHEACGRLPEALVDFKALAFDYCTAETSNSSNNATDSGHGVSTKRSKGTGAMERRSTAAIEAEAAYFTVDSFWRYELMKQMPKKASSKKKKKKSSDDVTMTSTTLKTETTAAVATGSSQPMQHLTEIVSVPQRTAVGLPVSGGTVLVNASAMLSATAMPNTLTALTSGGNFVAMSQPSISRPQLSLGLLSMPMSMFSQASIDAQREIDFAEFHRQHSSAIGAKRGSSFLNPNPNPVSAAAASSALMSTTTAAVSWKSTSSQELDQFLYARVSKCTSLSDYLKAVGHFDQFPFFEREHVILCDFAAFEFYAKYKSLMQHLAMAGNVSPLFPFPFPPSVFLAECDLKSLARWCQVPAVVGNFQSKVRQSLENELPKLRHAKDWKLFVDVCEIPAKFIPEFEMRFPECVSELTSLFQGGDVDSVVASTHEMAALCMSEDGFWGPTQRLWIGFTHFGDLLSDKSLFVQ